MTGARSIRLLWIVVLGTSCARDAAIPLSVRQGKRGGPVSLSIDAPRRAIPLRAFAVTATAASRSGRPLEATLEWILPQGVELVEGEVASPLSIPAAGGASRRLRLRLLPGATGTIVLRARGADPQSPWAREMVLRVGEPAPLPPPYELADGRALRLSEGP